MRFAALAIAALMVSPALAQEVPEDPDAPELVTQERHEQAPDAGALEPGSFLDRRASPTEDETGAGETVRDDDQPGSPVIVRRPGEGGIEVTPLAPPGSDLDEE